MVDDLERDLVEKARRGDSSAAPFLVSQFGERLLGYARSHAPDLSDADREQIVERAIEAGVRAIARFDPARGTLAGWFRTQVRYKTLAWRRANPVSVPLNPDMVEPPTSPPFDPAAVKAVRRAIGKLGRDDQIVLALRDAEQLDYREIAQRLNITEDAARQRHARAKKRLNQRAMDEPELVNLRSADNES
jgi:RNA polymerase sigma factor (sigma-70 family)